MSPLLSGPPPRPAEVERNALGIHVLVTITVSHALPIDIPNEDVAARAAIELARLQGGRRVTGHVERVRPGQTGRPIINEARQLRAVAIVMPLPPRTGLTLFGKTIEIVLADRPCRVILESEPAKRSANNPYRLDNDRYMPAPAESDLD